MRYEGPPNFETLKQEAREAGFSTVGVSAVIVKEGRILLVRRAEGELFSGRYEFPGGALEDDEGIEEGLAREVREEVGLHIKSMPDLLGFFDFIAISDSTPIRMFSFLVEVDAQEIILSEEHDDYYFASLEEIINGNIRLSDNAEQIVLQLISRNFQSR